MPTSVGKDTFWSGKGPKTSDPNRTEDDGFGVVFAPPNLRRACVPFLSPPMVFGDFQGSGLEYGPTSDGLLRHLLF